MSRKKSQPKKDVIPDPKFNSTIIPKLINNIMYDGKRVVAEKIVYDAIEKIKSKSKEEPINVFNEAINNIKPTVSAIKIPSNLSNTPPWPGKNFPVSFILDFLFKSEKKISPS